RRGPGQGHQGDAGAGGPPPGGETRGEAGLPSTPGQTRGAEAADPAPGRGKERQGLRWQRGRIPPERDRARLLAVLVTGTVNITCAGRNDVGVIRSGNEDTYLMVPDSGTVIVAEGLGGLPAGQLAT